MNINFNSTIGRASPCSVFSVHPVSTARYARQWSINRAETCVVRNMWGNKIAIASDQPPITQCMAVEKVICLHSITMLLHSHYCVCSTVPYRFYYCSRPCALCMVHLISSFHKICNGRALHMHNAHVNELGLLAHSLAPFKTALMTHFHFYFQFYYGKLDGAPRHTVQIKMKKKKTCKTKSFQVAHGCP